MNSRVAALCLLFAGCTVALAAPSPPVFPNRFTWKYSLVLPGKDGNFVSGYGFAYFDANLNNAWRFDEVYNRADPRPRDFSFDLLWWFGDGLVVGADFPDTGNATCGGFRLVPIPPDVLRGCPYAGEEVVNSVASYVWNCTWNTPSGVLHSSWSTSIADGTLMRWHIKDLFAESYFDTLAIEIRRTPFPSYLFTVPPELKCKI